jgi:PPOX class probable F420-dependent enzyme
MASLTDDRVRELLAEPYCAVVSTISADGSIHSAVAWIGLEDGVLAVNTSEGRHWASNLERDPHVTAVVYPPENPYEYVEIRGTAAGSRDDADDHINRLSKLYIGQDEYPFRQPGEVRIKFVITPERIRHQKQ